MKNFINILRYLSFPLIILGALFKIMHWPMAGLLLISAMTCMFLYFTLKYLFKGRLFWQDHVYFLLSTIVLFFVITRILHWPDLTIIIGSGLSIVIFLSALFIKKSNYDGDDLEEQESLFHSNIGILPLALVTLGVGLKILDIPGWSILFISGLLAQVVHMFLINSRAKKNENWEGILDSSEDLRDSSENEKKI